MAAIRGKIGNFFFIRRAEVLSDMQTYAIILIIYGLNSSLISKSEASGLFTGFLSNSFAMISLMKGETLEGRGGSSLSMINF
jgi:hypothetical protein